MVNKICSIVPEKTLKYLETDSEDAKELHLWGSHIKCSMPRSYEVDTSFLKDLKFYDPAESNIINNFSMVYNKNNDTSKSTNSIKDQNKVSISIY